MKITCTGRKVTLKEAFLERVEKKLAKLDKFFSDDAQAQVTVTVEKTGRLWKSQCATKGLPAVPRSPATAWRRRLIPLWNC